MPFNIPGTFVTIGVLVLLLVGAGGFIKYQMDSLALAEQTLKLKRQEIANKTATITALQIESAKNVEKMRQAQADVQAARKEQAEIQEKAMKDVSRVEKIAKAKSKLYERLVNRDYAKTQRELEGLTE